MMATSNPKELLTDLSPVIKVYTDGTVERLFVFPVIPPPPHDPTTGVSTKDAAISPFISARLYLPPTNPTNNHLPIFLHFHGGGFCVGSALSASDHRYLSLLSAASAALIISVDYRLAPEHPLPAAYDDAWTALEWLCSHATEQTGFVKDDWVASYGDFSRVFVGGDSSGGNIAHYIAMRVGSDPLPGSVKISGAILSPPYFWGSVPVGKEPKEDIEQSLPYRLWRFVFPSAGGGIDNPLINPLAGGAPSLSRLGCSKMMVCLSEKDLLTGRGRVYAEEVKKSGWKGDIQVMEVQGEDHCFHISHTQSQKAITLIHRMAAFISQ